MLTATAIACISIVGAGFLVALISVPFLAHACKIKSRCKAKTTGMVVEYKYKRNQNTMCVAPVVEFFVNGTAYKAYRHYKGVAVSKRSLVKSDEQSGENNKMYISENDFFHIKMVGCHHDYDKLAQEKWPLGSEMQVIYNPEKPEQAFAEKVVLASNTAGKVLAIVGGGLIALAGLFYLIFG